MIIPKITYAAIAWWDRIGIALARSELEHLQRAACIMITEATRTALTKVLEMFLVLPTLEIVVVCSTDGSIPLTKTKSEKPKNRA